MKTKPAPKKATAKKNRRRTEIRAEQRQRAHLEFHAPLAPHLLDRHRRAVTTPDGDVVWIGEGSVETLKDFLAEGMSLGAARLFADHIRMMATLAEMVGPSAIYQAKAELESAADAMKRKVQDVAERGDFAPFLDAVKNYRFTLFRDEDLLALAVRIDRAAIAGDKTATGNLNLLLKSLHVERGKTGSSPTDEEERRQKERTKQQPRRSKISKHKKELDDLYRKEDFKALKKRLAVWKNGPNALEKTAAKEWKPKKQQELR